MDISSMRRSKRAKTRPITLLEENSAAAAAAAQTSNISNIMHKTGITTTLSSLPRGFHPNIGQQQNEYIVNAPDNSRELLMGTNKFRDDLGNATVECNNTEIYKWPFDQDNINSAITIGNNFCPTFKFQPLLYSSAICYMTYAFFL